MGNRRAIEECAVLQGLALGGGRRFRGYATVVAVFNTPRRSRPGSAGDGPQAYAFAQDSCPNGHVSGVPPRDESVD
jgi:hypothetical protein